MTSASVSKTNRISARGLLRFGLPAHHGLLSVCILLLLLPSAGAQPGYSNNSNNDPYQQQRFSASMAIIIVVLIAALFFMGFFSIYIRHCSEVRNGGNTVRPGAGGGIGRSRRAARGVDQAVIDSFPTFEYSAVKGLKIGKGSLECAVCLNEFEDDETLRLLPKCDHVFHPECIDAWLASHVTCPVCRANLSEATEPEAAVETVESAGESDHEVEVEVDDRRPQIGDARDVSIRVAESENDLQQPPDVINPIQLFNQNRPPRSRSTRPRKFPRSHSTGHSLIQPGENCERFTLKLPDDVRKEIMKRALNRTTSLVVLPREGSSRRAYRTGEGSSRGKNFRRFDRLDRSGKFDRLDRSAKSDRWTFTITPPFFSRASSLKSPKVAADSEATTSTTPRKPTLTPKTSFGAKHDPAGTPPSGSPRPPV